jgi:hypothetical protein
MPTAAQSNRRFVRIQRKSVAVLVNDRHRAFDQQRSIRTNSNRNIAHTSRTFSNREDGFSRMPAPAGVRDQFNRLGKIGKA